MLVCAEIEREFELPQPFNLGFLGEVGMCMVYLCLIVKFSGVCCAEKDLHPKVLESCPAGSSPARLAACGVGLMSCPWKSKCNYANDWFGRCCVSDGQLSFVVLSASSCMRSGPDVVSLGEQVLLRQ